MTPIYLNPRVGRLRIVQAAVWVFGAAFVFIGASAGDGGLTLMLGLVAAAVIAAMEIFLRCYVTAIGYDATGWLLKTTSTFGERTLRFDAAQVSLGAEENQRGNWVLAPSYDNYHFQLRLAGQGLPFIIDSTPPAEFDRDAFLRYFR